MLTEEQEQKAKDLILAGAGRVKLEREFGLNEKDAYRLSVRVKIDEQLTSRPELLDDVRFLVEEGASRFQIKKQLGLSLEAADYLIGRARGVLVDLELAMDEPTAFEAAQKRAGKEEAGQQLLGQVRRLLEEGLGEKKIASDLSLELEGAASLVEEVRATQFLKPRMYSKQDKVDIVTRIKDDGGDAFRVARAMDIAPGSAQKIAKRAEGKSSIADETLKMAVAKGTTLVTLKNRFGFGSDASALEAVTEAFPGHFLYTKLKDDGDTGVTVIPDRTNVYQVVRQHAQPKQFRYSVSQDNNYMFIQFLPEFQGDHITIYNLTDVHVGHAKFQRERFIRDVAMIAADPCAFAVLGGDIIEWAHKASVGDPWEQIMSPMEQVPAAAELLEPILHKILGYRSGNHDKGRGRITGTDLAEVLATYLDVPYFKVETVIQVDFTPERLFTVILDHGHSGGSLQSIVRDASKFVEFSAFPVHAHFSGHVHNSFKKAFIHKVPNPTTMQLEFLRMHLIVGGSYLGYTSTYAEETKYSPTSQDLTFFEMRRDGSYKSGEIEANPV